MARSLSEVRRDLTLAHCDERSGHLAIKPEFQYQGCPYCDVVKCHPHTNTKLSKHLSCVRCDVCGLVYPLPRLNQRALDERVDAPALNEYLEASLGGTDAIQCQDWAEIRWLARRCGLARAPGFRALEVGCGSGGFLKGLVEAGFDAVGVEPNTALAAFCRRHGLRVVRDFFRPGVPLEKGFDLIVFRESLYHFFSVREALAAARELLREGGWLHVKAFNVDSFAIRCFARASGGINGLDIPANASPHSLEWILRDSGFQPLHTRYLPDNVTAYMGLAGPLPGFNRAVSYLIRALRASRNFAMLSRKRGGHPAITGGEV